jgi:type VI secretion system protein ImpC
VPLDHNIRTMSSRPDSDTPFRILVLGDFGASAASARPLFIDRDNFETVMARLEVGLELPGAGRLRLKELDDFHPDRLYESLDLFRGLREMRERVEDPETFRQAASELMEPARQPQPAVPIDFLSSGSLLDDIVESTEGKAGSGAAPVRRSDPFQKYLQAIVAPHIVPRPDPKQGEMLRQVDAAIAAQMRALLHEPRFQALEAAWRALFFLVRHAETNAQLKVFLLDLSKKSLLEDLLPATDLRKTAIYRVLVQETVATPGAQTWALIAGNYTFGSSNQDVELLGRIALLAAAGGSPMIARAGAALLGDGPEMAGWKELQTIDEARYIGLALPGFLLRLPYGKDTSSTERIAFEEMPGEPKHGEYLWGNPSFACAALIAEAFSESGWDMRPGDALDIARLPAHVYKKDGETQLKPCAEVLMTQSEAEALMERGLIPLCSMKDSDRVHVAGFRSITGKALAGRWE